MDEKDTILMFFIVVGDKNKLGGRKQKFPRNTYYTMRGYLVHCKFWVTLFQISAKFKVFPGKRKRVS